MTDVTPAPTRVLWLIKGLGPGGAEQLLASSAEVADHSRFRYLVAFVRADKDHLVARLEANGVSTRLLTKGSFGKVLWPLRLRSLMTRADIVHAHSPLLAGVARLLSRTIAGAHRPAVMSTEHNEWSSFTAPTRILNARTSSLDDHRLAVSERVRGSMSGAAAGATEVLVHGVVQSSTASGQGAQRDEVRAGLGIPRDAVVAITVANYRKEKDYPNLLNAVRLAVRESSRLHVLVVGQGPLEDEVRRLHGELQLDGRVHLLGFRADVPALLAAADIFVLGSVNEGLPVAIMEAMAAGLPIAATDVGGVSESVQPDVCGLIVPPKSPEALAEALLRLVRDAELRSRLGRQARDRSVMFDIRVAVRRQETLYEALKRA